MDSFAKTVFDICPFCQEKANILLSSNGPMCEKCYEFEVSNSNDFFLQEFVEND